MGGFGAAVMEFYQSEDLLKDIHIRCLGIPDEFHEQATVAKLHKASGIDVDAVRTAATKMLSDNAAWAAKAETKAAGA